VWTGCGDDESLGYACVDGTSPVINDSDWRDEYSGFSSHILVDTQHSTHPYFISGNYEWTYGACINPTGNTD